MKITDFRINDIIWTDDGQVLNTIIAVLSSEEAANEWGCDKEPSLLLAGFDAVDTSHRFTVMPESSLEENYVRRISDVEMLFFNKLKEYVYTINPNAVPCTMNVRCEYYSGVLNRVFVNILVDQNLKVSCDMYFLKSHFELIMSWQQTNRA